MSDKIEVSGGLGLASWLTIIFVVAKLFGLVHWSWWVVFSPVLVSMAIGLLVLTVVAAFGALLYFGGK